MRPMPITGSGQRNIGTQIPTEIIDIFERRGFIWGGKWSHYDTMHFEYRPELLTAPPATMQSAAAPR